MRQQIPAALANGWPAESADTRIRAVDRERHRDFGTCSTLGDRGLNVSRFCSPELEAKLKHATALQAEDQVAAAKLWAEVDRETANLAELIPTYTPRNIELVSKHVGNYQHHPLSGVLLDQLWVR
jgi:ABC-type transport system substrate-binding protein